jgi:cytochrome c-type biogenesis protein CcsB
VSTQTFAQLSNGFVYGTLVVLALAMLAFAAELAFGTRSRVARTSEAALAEARQLVSVSAGGRVESEDATAAGPTVVQDPSDDPGGPGGAGGAGGAGPSGDGRQRRADRFGGIAASLTVLGTLLLLLGVACRGFAAHRAPWGNMYEFSTTSALVVLVVSISVARRRPALRYLGIFVIVPVLLTLGLAITVLYVPAGPLLPALKSYWLVIHVAAAIISGSVFMVGGVVTILYLAQDRWERAGVTNSLSRRLPPADQLDQSAYRLFAFVFPLWTFAIVAGAIWAENAWGAYWSWDPKETWALVTWVVFAGYLHARATAGWKGRKAAFVGLLGMCCFIFNYFVVNILFTGLHAYGGLPNK